FQLVLATVLRIIIPFRVGSNALNECTNCTAAVVTYFSAASRVLFILTTLFLLSISLADLTADWISVAYIPLLIYMMSWTYYSLFEEMKNVEESYEGFMNELAHYWWSNDTYWFNLEKKLQCCGLGGPRTYMEYLRKVPGHCYKPQLITLGCGQMVHDLLDPMLRIGRLMRIITLAIELYLLYFYGVIVCKKLASLIAER
ncbi:hypothetical protein KR059_004156, partial [Drosophila kikkawai]